MLDMTRVVNIRNEKYDVYIGREGRGQEGYFGNPFRLSENETRGATIERYKAYFYERLLTDTEFRRRVHELKGKTLGCFCKPHSCHGDVIKEYLDSLDKPDIEEKIDRWWAGLGFKEMEYITGYNYLKFDPEDGFQDFVDTCDEEWKKKSVADKIELYHMLIGD